MTAEVDVAELREAIAHLILSFETGEPMVPTCPLCAAAVNSLPSLLDRIEQLEAEKKRRNKLTPDEKLARRFDAAINERDNETARAEGLRDERDAALAALARVRAHCEMAEQCGDAGTALDFVRDLRSFGIFGDGEASR